MKQALFSVLFTAFVLIINAQADNKIVIGTIDSIHSKILNEERKIWVHVPGKGITDVFGKQNYPVVYVLDGDTHFLSVVGLVHQLSAANGNRICPPMIVVGITNTDRTRDLTPTHYEMDSTTSFDKTSGGGKNFISFIKKELIPYIDSSYPTEPYRMLIGHSLGGLIVVESLVRHPELFNSYVAIDPSMWWDNQSLLKEVPRSLAIKDYSRASFFLGMANSLPPGMDTVQARADTTMMTLPVRSVLDLEKYLNNNKQSKLKTASKYYNDEDHISVPLITEYDALRFIFNDYRLILTMEDYMDFNKAVIAKVEKHYEKVSKQFGYPVRVPETLANDFGYQNLGNKNFEEAEYLFRLNVKNYPESSNAFDSLADFFVAKGDKANAILNYKKALSIREVADTRRKLEELQKK